MIEAAREKLMQQEGCNLDMYLEDGYLHIGWGTLLHEPISQDAADFLFYERLKVSVKACELLFYPQWPTFSEPRQVAFVTLLYCMGRGRFETFEKTIAAAKRGEWHKCADEVLSSRWARRYKTRAGDVARIIRFNEL